ncbi:phosphatidate cytidylyltransferase family protein [Thermoascus aurantiacus ATCC 26904]
MSSTQYSVPATPRVISPSPTPSERSDSRDSYTGPVTRSASRRQRLASSTPSISEEGKNDGGETESDLNSEKRARRKSRGPAATSSGSSQPRMRRQSSSKSPKKRTTVTKSEPLTNGHLSPNGRLSPHSIHDHLRDDPSRSPSPLGLIPLHRHYRTFIHRHEIPRKLLHVSIGFLTLHLYSRGIQTFEITPLLISALVPIAATDFLRHRSQTVNKLYIRCLGALMRETEVDHYNGVIWYLLGAYIVLRFFPKDVGVMGVLLLSWCDTAASTFGRLYGRYTMRLRRGKSLAGTLGAWFVGVVTAATFWGYFVPRIGTFPNDPEGAFMFTGRLNLLPDCIRGLLGWTNSDASSGVITGPWALGVMSVVSGIVAAGSELIDLFGLDDNLTIPVLSGIGLWGFLKVFG